MPNTLNRKPQDVYFFCTCLVDLFVPEAGLDAVTLLEREGVRVHFPEYQTCCGQPAYTSGQPEEALAVARQQLDLFPEPWPIVLPSGSCTGMMRHHYPTLFAGTADAANAAAVAARVWSSVSFLQQSLILIVLIPVPHVPLPCIRRARPAGKQARCLRRGHCCKDLKV